jgi:predicted oxidoreductase
MSPSRLPQDLSSGTDAALSPIVAGAWRMAEWGLDVPARVSWIEQCIELGITSFDHADIYGNYSVEALFGQALAAAPGLRRRIQIVTKCGIKLVSSARPQHRIKSYDSSRAHVLASVAQSLAALHTDHIDLLLIHRPDLLMQPDDLADTFAQLKAEGKVLQVGVSNHSPRQFALLHRRHPLVTNQIELSPLQLAALEDGTLEQCVELGLRPMVWSPLGGGRLFTGRDKQAAQVRSVLQALSVKHAVSMATIAYAWILRHPSAPRPLTGSGRVEALREAVAALAVQLSAEDWYAVWQASKGHEVP